MADCSFLSSSWVFSSFLVMIPSIAVSVGVMWMIRRMVSTDALRKNHDVAGFTFSIIGVLYSVVLGFTVINVEDRYIKTEENIHTEAMLLADLYRTASYFPPSGKKEIQAGLREYVKYIAEEEWEDVKDKSVHLKAQKVLDQIWNSYYRVNPENQKMWVWYQGAVEKLDDLMNARLSRQFDSWQHLSGLMWALLIVGGIITVCFMFFFGLENLRNQMLMTALLSGYISFMLYLVFYLDHAFKGPESIRPSAFEQISILFDRWDAPEGAGS